MTPMEKVLGPSRPTGLPRAIDPDQRADQALRQGDRPERLHDHRPRGPDLRADRPERRGQDHAAALARRAWPGRPPGQVTVNGSTPRQDPAFLADIGYLAQEIPLYRRLSAEDHIRAGAHLNPRWDGESVRERLTALKIPLNRPVGKLSGGQRAQVALALILAKRPRLLLLDEPVAALDPLARRNFLGLLADGVAAGGLTVMLSSHLVADLERVCDHLIMLAASRVQLCGDIDDLLAEHRILVGPSKDTTAIERGHRVVQATRTPRQTTLLVRLNGPVLDPAFQASDVSLEELVLAYMGEDARAGPRAPHHGWRRYNDLACLAPAPHPVLRGRRPAGRVRRPDRDHRRSGGGSVPRRAGRLRREPQLRHLGGAVHGQPRGGLPGHLDAGRAGPGRAVLGRPAGGRRGSKPAPRQFAWMQSVTRKRWLAVKIGWMLLAAAIWGGVISVLVTWWSSPNNAEQLNQFNPGRFDIMGLVPVAYSLFAMALGIAAGALLRRTLPAMAVTLAGFIGVRVVVALLLRPHYLSAVTVFYKVTGGFNPPGPSGRSRRASLGPNGQPLAQPNNVPYSTAFHQRPAGLLPRSTARGTAVAASCVQALAHYRAFITYQPANRFWAFQGIETGIRLFAKSFTCSTE